MTPATPLSLSTPFIRRPVATVLLTVGIFLFGLVAFPLLPVAPLPQVEFPTLQVSASLPGASPETMASSVATPLENQLALIPGITQMSSVSGLGTVSITLQFDLDIDIDAAAQEVQAAINPPGGRLDRAAEPAHLPQGQPCRLATHAAQHGLRGAAPHRGQRLREQHRRPAALAAARRRAGRHHGRAETGGTRAGRPNQARRSRPQPRRRARRHAQATVNSPKGSLDGPNQSFAIYANDQLLNAAPYNDLILAYRNGAPIRVRDVGRAVAGPETSAPPPSSTTSAPRHHGAARQQELGPVARRADRREGQPGGDVTYLGGQVGPQARDAGVLTPYKPARWNDIPATLKDPDGYWFTIHSGTLGLFVNTAALRGKPVPRAWKDLLKPEYKGLVGYLNPASAAVGQVGVIAVALALGGSYDKLDPAIAFFKQLQANQPIVPTQTAYARVLSGEIPILLDYDFNAYRAKYTDKAPVEFVIPQEGTQQLPYVMGLVNKGPNPEQGRKMLDFVLSDDGQRHWANAFLRPVFPAAMSAEVKGRFLPDADYARARPLDVFKLSAAAKVIGERYQKEVG